MFWWQPHNFDKKRSFLVRRARIISTLRRFFDDQDFLEVETPALQVCPVMDAHIHGFKTELKNVDLSHSKNMYLHTSPEFDMKKLLVAGLPKIYQICHVFRNGEASKLHSPEFTILEWYRAGADYNALMDDCVDMLRNVTKMLGVENYTYQGISSNPNKEWQKISVVEAFTKHANINLLDVLGNITAFAKSAENIGVRVVGSDSWEDIFHAVMAEKIEPNLGVGVPCILYDYPLSMAALSRKKPSDERFAERFELYVCGVELANAFSELTDVKEQRKRYTQEMELKQKLYGETYPADEEFFAALELGMPESAGIALGIDRLVMLACGAEAIDNVIFSPVQKQF